MLNRNKKGIVINLKTEDGQALFGDYLERTDVLIQNLRPGSLEKLGLGIDHLRATYPRLIILSISGFGLDGPWSSRPAYDIIVQAMSGYMAVTGDDDGPPQRVGVSIGDVIPGTLAAFAVMSALVRRMRCGSGAIIDLSMFDALIASLESVSMRAIHSDDAFQRRGSHHAVSAPYGTFRTRTDEIVIAAPYQKLFARLAGALGHPEWIEDPRFHDPRDRGDNWRLMRCAIEDALAQVDADRALEVLGAAGVPCAPILDPREAIESEHAQYRRLILTEPDGFKTVGTGFRLDEYTSPLVAAPALDGDHGYQFPANSQFG